MSDIDKLKEFCKKHNLPASVVLDLSEMLAEIQGLVDERNNLRRQLAESQAEVEQYKRIVNMMQSCRDKRAESAEARETKMRALTEQGVKYYEALVNLAMVKKQGPISLGGDCYYICRLCGEDGHRHKLTCALAYSPYTDTLYTPLAPDQFVQPHDMVAPWQTEPRWNELGAAIEAHEKANPTMNIYSPQGAKVVFTGKGGYQAELERACKSLVVGEVYTVERTEVGDWHTSVYLKERPGESFNSVQFAAALASREDDNG